MPSYAYPNVSDECVVYHCGDGMEAEVQSGALAVEGRDAVMVVCGSVVDGVYVLQTENTLVS